MEEKITRNQKECLAFIAIGLVMVLADLALKEGGEALGWFGIAFWLVANVWKKPDRRIENNYHTYKISKDGIDGIKIEEETKEK